jgi:hypothetical protein
MTPAKDLSIYHQYLSSLLFLDLGIIRKELYQLLGKSL